MFKSFKKKIKIVITHAVGKYAMKIISFQVHLGRNETKAEQF